MYLIIPAVQAAAAEKKKAEESLRGKLFAANQALADEMSHEEAMEVSVRTHTHSHTRTHTLTHARTHTQKRTCALSFSLCLSQASLREHERRMLEGKDAEIAALNAEMDVYKTEIDTLKRDLAAMTAREMYLEGLRRVLSCVCVCVCVCLCQCVCVWCQSERDWVGGQGLDTNKHAQTPPIPLPRRKRRSIPTSCRSSGPKWLNSMRNCSRRRGSCRSLSRISPSARR